MVEKQQEDTAYHSVMAEEKAKDVENVLVNANLKRFKQSAPQINNRDRYNQLKAVREAVEAIETE